MSRKFLPRSVPAGIAILLFLETAAPRPAAGQVVINEVLASNRAFNIDEDRDASDWVELYNTGSAPADITGYGLSDDEFAPLKWVFPQTVIPAGGYLLVWCSGKDRFLPPPEKLLEANSPLPFEPVLVDLEAEWRFLTGAPDAGAPPAGWNLPGFDDSAWLSGKPGFGFGDDDDVTVLPNGIGAVFLRHVFTWDPARKLANLIFQAKYDDGFIIYLNGARVLSVGFSEEEEPTFASTAVGSREARFAFRFDISRRLDLIQPGENLIAAVLLNTSPLSNDLSLIPELGVMPPVFHTNFRIDHEGEAILLAEPGGRILDSVALPLQVDDQSFGRSPDGSGPFLYHLQPTPGAPNDGPTGTQPLVVADTKFSVHRGFFDAPFEVEIATATPGAVIRYTLDGAPPDESTGIVYSAPIPIESTTTLRAAAFKEGLVPSNVDTQTYIFLDDIIRQNYQATLARGFPASWGGNAPDYGMDPDVIGQTGPDRYAGKYAATVRSDLLSLPTLSIVVKIDDLFGAGGIYTNSTSRGAAWERPASVEMIQPDGSRGFQIDCGIRIHGGAFRSHGLTRKHNLRLLFKRVYGKTKLEFPLFDRAGAAESFDTLVLRANSNDGYQWDSAGGQALYIRDAFGRETLLDMGGVSSHQRFVHLYIDGAYWGLYEIVERPDAAFSATYFGGDKDEWDAISNDAASNGTTAAWVAMLGQASRGLAADAAYEAIQGNFPGGADDPALESQLDIRNLIDYMITNLYVGNTDWPHKNWWVGRRRGPASTGFKFYMWDSEWSMGIRSDLNTNQTGVSSGVSGPYAAARANPEFRMLFADRLHRHFFNGGALYVDPARGQWDPAQPERNRPAARFERLAAAIEQAMVAESARWGDQHAAFPYTRDEHWSVERRNLLLNYFTRRSGIVLQQFRAAGLYPTVEAPVFSSNGGRIQPGFALSMTAPAGEILYTLDGSDPRLRGGAVSPSAALAAPEGVILDGTTRVRARAFAADRWSALAEADFIVPLPLRITEIMYHPPPPPAGSRFAPDDFEFIELLNTGDRPIDLRDVRLEGGIEFDLGAAGLPALEPGQYLVVVRSLEAFRSRYAIGAITIAGEYTRSLGNGGDLIILRGPLGETVHEFFFGDWWYPTTDGRGPSLVIADPLAPPESWGDPASWRPSRLPGGSPGMDDSETAPEGGLQRPGDSNQDGRLNISDSIHLLLRLFGGGAAALPCEGNFGDGGNRILLDIDGDAQVDISDPIFLLEFLFLAGPRPAAGTDCLRVVGCPNACSPL